MERVLLLLFMLTAKKQKKKFGKPSKVALCNLRTFSLFLPTFTHRYTALSQKKKEHLQGCSFLFCLHYISICNNTTPQTHGKPNIPLPPTVHQLTGTETPVNFWVRFIIAMAAMPNSAFKRIDFKNL